MVLLQEDIENAVERVCSLMPHTLSEECQDYVEAYGDQVIELLAQEIDPAKVKATGWQQYQLYEKKDRKD